MKSVTEYTLKNPKGEKVGTLLAPIGYARRLNEAAKKLHQEDGEDSSLSFVYMDPDPNTVDPATEGWISIKETIPTPNQKVRIFGLSEGDETAVFSEPTPITVKGNTFEGPDGKPYTWYTDEKKNGCWQHRYITHWRPLASNS